MIVCHCNVFSDHDVRTCLKPGPGCPRTPAQIYACLGCSPQCGRCARTIRSVIERALAPHGDCSADCRSTCPRAEAGVTDRPGAGGAAAASSG